MWEVGCGPHPGVRGRWCSKHDILGLFFSREWGVCAKTALSFSLQGGQEEK